MTNEFSTFKLNGTLHWLRIFFSIFQFDVKDCFINLESSNTRVGCYKESSGVTALIAMLNEQKKFVFYEMRQF